MAGLTTMPFRRRTNGPSEAGASAVQMQERLANSHAGNLDRTGPRTLVRQSRLSGHDQRFGVGVHETTFRVNVRWVTPLGEETASTS